MSKENFQNMPNYILLKIETYLRQQADLYGEDLLFFNKANSEKTKSNINSVDKPTEQILSKVQKNTSITPPTKVKVKALVEEESLFQPVVNSSWNIDPQWNESQSLDELNSKIKNCLKCPLGSSRKNFVFGTGNPNAKLVLIGEAPGADEDEQGAPFVGRAGQLLTKILAAVQLSREEVFICNILKCRPPNNREPLPSEVEACEPYLRKQLNLIKPKLILCLGRTAAQALLKTNASLSELRTGIYNYSGIKVLVTYHPAALLRNPNWKRPAWEDMQRLRKLYDEVE
ncbi:MAG: uracil-DNA glycosylase [Candidatus Kryptoniota bacterium]